MRSLIHEKWCIHCICVRTSIKKEGAQEKQEWLSALLLAIPKQILALSWDMGQTQGPITSFLPASRKAHVSTRISELETGGEVGVVEELALQLVHSLG